MSDLLIDFKNLTCTDDFDFELWYDFINENMDRFKSTRSANNLIITLINSLKNKKPGILDKLNHEQLQKLETLLIMYQLI